LASSSSRRFLRRVEDLAHHPDIGRVVPEFEQPVLRDLIQPPFRVVYRREPERVRVVRVWRSERLLRLRSQRGWLDRQRRPTGFSRCAGKCANVRLD
jgi:plasmid stabilization system protein ParE